MDQLLSQPLLLFIWNYVYIYSHAYETSQISLEIIVRVPRWEKLSIETDRK